MLLCATQFNISKFIPARGPTNAALIHAVFGSLGPNLGPRLSLVDLAPDSSLSSRSYRLSRIVLAEGVREFKSRRSDQKPP